MPDVCATIAEAAPQVQARLAEALKAEARPRVEQRRFYGSITFASVIARKPARA